MKKQLLTFALLFCWLTAWADPVPVSSAALESGHILYVGKATFGSTLTVRVYSNKGATQFIQLFDSATIPADGAVPFFSQIIKATDNLPIDIPIAVTNGVCISNSSTALTKTAGLADCAYYSYSTAALHPK